MATFDDEGRLDWLRLIRTDSIGPITFARLVARFGTPSKAIEALPRIAAQAGRKSPLRAPSRESVAAELRRAKDVGARAIMLCDDEYPKLVAAIPDPPPVIYVRGEASLLDRPAVAIIGARNASAMGRKIAQTFARDLGAAGLVVVSGLARGIDGAAHQAALETGTIAVVAGGVDVIYPPEHAELTEEIAFRGLILTEQPPGAQPTARDFPRRNRLISGLSRGVVVVEAAAKSGTLITARFALEQGREVFAVPGSPLDPRCQGANNLIRDGATLTQNADDILDVIARQIRGVREGDRDTVDWGASAGVDDTFSDADHTRAARLVREALSYTPTHRDDFLRTVDAPPTLIIDALVELVISGVAEEHSGGRFALKAD